MALCGVCVGLKCSQWIIEMCAQLPRYVEYPKGESVMGTW